MTFEYLTAEPDDAKEVITFLRDLQSERLTTITRMTEFPTCEQEREWIGRHKEGKGVVFVAKNGRQILGLLNAEVLQPAEFSGNLRFGLSVLREYRGKGVATRLIGMLDRWAGEHRMDRIELEVFGNNENAIRLYRKLGFIEDGRRIRAVRLWDEGRVDMVHMYKVPAHQRASLL